MPREQSAGREMMAGVTRSYSMMALGANVLIGACCTASGSCSNDSARPVGKFWRGTTIDCLASARGHDEDQEHNQMSDDDQMRPARLPSSLLSASMQPTTPSRSLDRSFIWSPSCWQRLSRAHLFQLQGEGQERSSFSSGHAKSQ